VPDLLDIIMVQATFQDIEGVPLIGVRDPVITGYRSWAKRGFDILTASFCIVLFSPFFAMIPVLIRLDSRGKAVFIQRRAGENGRPFNMFKFRTMIESAEAQLKDLVNLDELDSPAFKIPNDPRITRIGRFLRRTSLDELPQFFNVLIGDMSMVGPRPEAMDVVSRYNLEQRRRLSVKPGITGPMQIHGRGDLPLDDRIRLELKYIAKYSLLEDVKYVIRTIPAVYHGKGAY
jgi:lipopolysaccharide/colanic/teichoic acid biosynthesis glycosyltransferase